MLIKKYEYKTQFVECNLMQLFCINSAGVPQTSNIDIKCHGIGKLSWVLIHEEVFQCFFFPAELLILYSGIGKDKGPPQESHMNFLDGSALYMENWREWNHRSAIFMAVFTLCRKLTNQADMIVTCWFAKLHVVDGALFLSVLG